MRKPVEKTLTVVESFGIAFGTLSTVLLALVINLLTLVL